MADDLTVGLFGPNVDDALHNFSRALTPSDQVVREGKLLAQKIFDALKTSIQSNTKYSIGRHYYNGSNVKAPIITCFPNMDVTIFVNDEEPAFKQVLEDFASIITSSFGIDISEVRQTGCSVQFKVLENGIDGRKQNAGFDIDLIPAVNLVYTKTSQIAYVQLDEVIKRIEQDPTKRHFYTGSLVESHLDFMLQQKGFTVDLVRLAKFWYKSIFLGEYVPGGNMIIELVAVAASKVRRQSLHDAFMFFLCFMNRLYHLRLVFYFEKGVWDVYHSSANAIEGVIPPRVSSRFPGINLSGMERFILEPANPYNNLLSALPFTVIRKLMKYARETTDRFKIPRVHSVEKGEPFLMMCNYFRPLPTKLITADPALHLNSTSADYLIGYIVETSSTALLNPVAIVRNRSILRSSKIQKAQALQNLVDAHLQFITTTANAATYSGKRQNFAEIVDSVCQMIDQDIRGTFHKKWMTSKVKTHETHDVTFKVPITTPEGFGVIVVSVKWDYHGRAGNCYKE